MDEESQLALVVFFAAVLLVSGQLFMQYRSSKSFDGPVVVAVTRGVKTP
jgi:hypothetical protein